MPSKKQLAVAAVLKAVQLCQQVETELVSTDSLQKADRSPVTVADFGAQALICKAIGDAFPGTAIVAEEDAASLKANPDLLKRVVHYVNSRQVQSGCSSASPEVLCEWINRGTDCVGKNFWTLDPIDGTKGFLRHDQYAIALAEIVNGEVVLGILACPNLPQRLNAPESERGCLFVAVRGEGTAMYSLTGNFLGEAHVGNEADRLAESFESTHGDSDRHAEIAHRLKMTAPPIQMDSQAKYALLARGDISLYLRLPNPASPDYRECIWDHAAGLIIVEEAGGMVTDANGALLNFGAGRRMVENRGIVATNGKIHSQVLEAVRPL